MARKRMIDPTIWQSEDFSRLSILARLVFIGMFSHADDYGYGRAKSTYIKSVVFPYDENVRVSDVDKTLNEIASNMSVIFYTHDGNEYYSLTNWGKWQKVEKPSDSNIPAFDEYSTMIRGSVGEDSGNSRGTIPPNRIEEKLIEKKRKEYYAQTFEKFYRAYPRKAARKKAEDAWSKLKLDNELLSIILSALEIQKKSEEWIKDKGKYIPYPATWLNGRRWEDSKGGEPPDGDDYSQLGG